MDVAVKYLGPLQSYSGYGSANRSFVCALKQVGVDVTTQTVYFDNNRENYFGSDYELIRDLEGKNVQYDIKIIHTPCDSYLKYLEPCRYHIGHLFWETDKMSPEWVWNCNLLDEIWTGSEFNRKVFQQSGVNVPIYIFPETVNHDIFDAEKASWTIPGHEGFLFLSIFQWIERKNPELLVKAYLQEFSADEKVSLMIKTYKRNFTDSEKGEIKDEIKKWANEVKKSKFPRLYVSVELLEKEDLAKLYNTCDCYVLPHRGEGWSRTMHEAMLAGRPCIATNLGGIHDWLPRETYYPLTYTARKVFNMDWAPWYRQNQTWAEVSVDELRKKMRYVFEHQSEAKEVGEWGKNYVRQNFSYEAVGRMMKDRLIDIQKMIDEERQRGVRWLEH